MNYKSLGVALVWALLTSPAVAAPLPEAKSSIPPAPAKAPGDVPMRKVALLGMATTEAMLSPGIKTGLPDGVGLIVQHVSPGTPAAKAGFQRFDVLYKLNDQVLINNPQLRVLLRTMKPGERVTFSVLRRPQPATVANNGTATIGMRRLVRPVAQPLSVEVQLGEAEVPVVETPCGMPVWVTTPARGADSQATLSSSYEDNQHLLILQDKGIGGKHLVVRDKLLGTVLFDGPIDTDEQRQNVPELVRKKLRKLENPPPPKPTAPEPSAAEPSLPSPANP